MESVRPTITDDIRGYYEQIEDKFRGGREMVEQQQGGRIGFQ
jgi:transitional endoplasmic reticulum ATPase